MSNKDEEDLESQLRWINLRADLDAMEEEPTLEKMKRKFASNPLIPIGVTATSGAIIYGLYCLYLGDSRTSQLMMRYRVGFQFFTICAFLGGFGLANGGANLNPFGGPKGT